MERPQTEESLRKHPRMTLQNRAKIFSPFSPLRGYDEQLAAEKQRTERVPKRILTEEEMSALSDRLMQVTKGMTITVRYFKEDTARPGGSRGGQLHHTDRKSRPHRPGVPHLASGRHRGAL